jgi:hypothetical protein
MLHTELFFHPVGEETTIYHGAKFEGVIHVAKNFNANFFAKIMLSF